VRLSKLFNKLVSSYMEHWSLVEGKHFSVPLLENGDSGENLCSTAYSVGLADTS